MNILTKELPEYDPVDLVRELNAQGIPYWKIAIALRVSEGAIKKWMCGVNKPHPLLWVVAGAIKGMEAEPSSDK